MNINESVNTNTNNGYVNYNVTRLWNTVHLCGLTCQPSHGRSANAQVTMAILTCVQDSKPNQTNKRTTEKKKVEGN